jgi:NTP pyrophosphatase (non-canonical NTP hydrolase)
MSEVVNVPENEEAPEVQSLDQYQIFVRSTKVYDKEYNLVYPVLGLVNEAGEVAGKVKKLMRDDNGQLTEERFNDILSELGDVLWYVTATADDLGVTISDVFFNNYMKLKSRQERGMIKGSGDHR